MSKKDSHTLGEALVSITARFPTSLAAQIDDHLAAMRRTIPGITLARSDALRSLVLHALEALYGPSAGGAPAIITDTSTRRLLQKEKRRAREGDVTDTVTDTIVTDTAQLARRLRQEFEAFLDSRSPLIQAILHAQPVTDTVTDTHGQPGGVSGATRTTQGVTDTVTDTESVADTVTVTGQAREPFDTTRYYLGKLCPHGHDFEGTGHSLLRQHNQRCRECENESRREKRQAKREAQPVVR